MSAALLDAPAAATLPVTRPCRILLIQPPLDPRVISLGTFEPLALEVLAGALDGHTVEILDARFDRDVAAAVRRLQPDIIGLTGITPDYRPMCACIAAAHAAAPAAWIVVGGFHATMAPEDFARLPGVTAIVIGLGHRTLAEIVAARSRGAALDGIAGLALPDGEGGLQRTAPRAPEDTFSDIPAPRRDLTARWRRRYGPTFGAFRTGVAITSLGCPFRCSFCTTWKQNAGRYLEREVDAIVEDLSRVPEPEVFIGDDNFLHNTDRAWALVAALRRRPIGKTFVSYARADTIAGNPDLIQALASVGLKALVVGFEAVDEARLAAFNKKTVVETNRRAAAVLAEAGVAPEAQFVVAQDFTDADFDLLSRTVRAWGLWRVNFTILTPVPGTPFHQQSRKRLLTHEHAYFDYVHSVLPTTLPWHRFRRRYCRLFTEVQSPLRWWRCWFSELGTRLRTGQWPRTDRALYPFWRVLQFRLLFSLFRIKLAWDWHRIDRERRQRERTGAEVIVEAEATPG